MIDSTRLSSFSVFAEELNFTRAAKRLHISQPALHVQIAKLAESVEAPLYRRRGRSLELTSAGRHLQRFALDQQQQHEAIRAQLRGEVPVPRITLASGTGALLYVMGPAVVEFRKRTKVQLRILARDAAGTLAALSHGEAHAGIVAKESVPDEFSTTLLARSHLRAVMPSRVPLARKRRLRIRDLQGQALILPPPDRPHRQQVERALQSADVSWQLALETTGWEVMLRYASLGLGIALVNDICHVPRGLVSRPFADFPAVTYRWVEADTRRDLPELVQLRQLALQAFKKTL